MRCPLFVELCAGTAALSLRLHHPRAIPPVSRMGAKTGYADVILRCMGLRPGQGSADGTRYLWCEPDKGVRLLLHALTSRSLALAAAEVIRGWATSGESPRALWERLRAEGPVICRPVDAREVARWSYIQTANAAIVVDPVTWKNTGNGGATFDARTTGRNGRNPYRVIQKLLVAPTLSATITDDARQVDPPQLPPGVVVYIDPPYENCTGYSHVFPRGAWLPVVRRWVEAGALVVVSEAEPIPELMAEGWHAVQITGERKGQRRTFSRQQREWLTMSRAPAWRPSVQVSLFNAQG